jgi:phosphoglycerate dehydrogenase-like enzyme
MSLKVVFHGANAACFSEGFAALVESDADVRLLPDTLTTEADRAVYAGADVIIGVKFDATLPSPEKLALFHVPGAGYDAVDLDRLPARAMVCNCFGHEQAIAEYVMAAMLARHVPLADADRRLRQGDWAYWAGANDRAHDEMAGKSVGLLGYGHIGKAIAARAKAFEMTVHVANRSAVATGNGVDSAVTLDRLTDFWGRADFIVVSVPLTPETTGIVGEAAFRAMRADTVVFNVGRGPTIDETALFEALRDRRIGGAVIDTWYTYPSATESAPMPSRHPFQDLGNVVMTPHMSGWTSGTIRRRQRTIADNINRRFAGRDCINVVRPGG